MTVKNQHFLSLPPPLFECLQGLDSPSWTCEGLTICSKSGKEMSEKLLSASGMDATSILWCHLVSSVLKPYSSTFWFHTRAAALAGKYSGLVTVKLFTKTAHFVPLGSNPWPHRLLNLSYSTITYAMASQRASPYSEWGIRRSSRGISSKPSPCKVWGHTLLAGELVGKTTRLPPGLAVLAQTSRACPTPPTGQNPISAQARAVHTWSED